ncbi:hypothetical protein PVAP13_6KG398433 [Panicum virgatum]|uniref:Uncharacterized protein n=1 Tax=Panicum virgatum TaxID=38727 RepID=A0A8T0RKT2_PANVG|nr:hypothetical protein PVAP13_6KG398433 [Panicum virgatum]
MRLLSLRSRSAVEAAGKLGAWAAAAAGARASGRQGRAPPARTELRPQAAALAVARPAPTPPGAPSPRSITAADKLELHHLLLRHGRGLLLLPSPVADLDGRAEQGGRPRGASRGARPQRARAGSGAQGRAREVSCAAHSAPARAARPCARRAQGGAGPARYGAPPGGAGRKRRRRGKREGRKRSGVGEEREVGPIEWPKKL